MLLWERGERKSPAFKGWLAIIGAAAVLYAYQRSFALYVVSSSSTVSVVHSALNYVLRKCEKMKAALENVTYFHDTSNNLLASGLQCGILL